MPPRRLLGSLILPVVLISQIASAQQNIVLVGSGSNVPLHVYQTWATEFNRTHPALEVRYLALGASESIKSIGKGIGDFGGGEIPLTESQLRGSSAIAPIPMLVVAIVPVYNLPGNPALRFSGELLGEIFLGTVKNWHDPRIARLNPTLALPDLPLTVVHRPPGKGSNFIITDFLSKTNPQFRAQIGTSASPHWPVGAEANRGEDLVEKVAATPGAIGYVESNLAGKSGVGYGRVQNAAGQFVAATPDSIEAACVAAESASPDSLLLNHTNAPGAQSYPIVSFTWLYVPSSGVASDRRAALKQFLTWALSDGQTIARDSGYAPLPAAIAAKAQTIVNSLP